MKYLGKKGGESEVCLVSYIFVASNSMRDLLWYKQLVGVGFIGCCKILMGIIVDYDQSQAEMGQNLTKVHYNSTIIYFSRILAHFSPALIIVHYNPRENFATIFFHARSRADSSSSRSGYGPGYRTVGIRFYGSIFLWHAVVDG